MRSRRRAGTVVVAALLLSATLSQAALAGFTDPTAASMPVSTAALSAPTNPSAVASCVLLAPRVTVSWTASTSSFASGYQIYRRPAVGGSLALVGSVSGVSSTSYDDTTVVLGGAYVYVVDAVFQNWSASTAEVAVTVPLVCA